LLVGNRAGDCGGSGWDNWLFEGGGEEMVKIRFFRFYPFYIKIGEVEVSIGFAEDDPIMEAGEGKVIFIQPHSWQRFWHKQGSYRWASRIWENKRLLVDVVGNEIDIAFFSETEKDWETLGFLAVEFPQELSVEEREREE
jgi:hypothetical protein